MFVDYQKARNAVVGTVAAAGAGIAAFFGLGGDDAKNAPDPPARVAAVDRPATAQPAVPTVTPQVPEKTASSKVAKPNQNFVPAQKPKPQPAAKTLKTTPQTVTKAETDSQRYANAMKLALGKADPSGTAKDILGPSSKWKLNLYDDDLDGQYDRGKLDKDRDDIEDEKWTYKKGRWEKDSGRKLWLGDQWVGDPGVTLAKSSGETVDQRRYRAAMQIATGRADRSGKGKDVLGPRSPWKLNLYDDNKDGQWDRAKLDTNRDEKDDEKWNFKKGRWEKDGGATIWNGKDWTSS